MSLKTILYLGSRPFVPKKHGIKGVILHTIIVVAIAMLPLVVVLMVADGMIQGITSRYIETSSYHFRVYSRQSADNIDFDLYHDTKKKLDTIEDIKISHLERVGAGLGVSGNSREGIQIRGVSPDILELDTDMKKYISITQGKFDLTGSNSVVVSSSLARKMNISVGDDFRIITGKILKKGKILPRVTRMKVSGIAKTGYEDLDKNWVFIPFELSKKILPNRSSFTFIGLKYTDPYGDLKGVYKEIKRHMPSGWKIVNWTQLNSNTYENFKTTKMVLALIMGLIVIVAGINISSSLIMLVLEKRRDIAILKGMGLSPNEVMGSYLLTGVIIGFIGTLIGIIVGLLISININQLVLGMEVLINYLFKGVNFILNIDQDKSIILLDTAYYLDNIPIDVNFSKLLFMTFFSIITTSMASYFPARKAGLIKPLEIMQKY